MLAKNPTRSASAASAATRSSAPIRSPACRTGPDAASVNLSEPAAIDTMRALMGVGIRVEAGVWTTEDAELLLRSGIAERVERVLVELQDVPASDVEAAATEIHAVLDRAGTT